MLNGMGSVVLCAKPEPAIPYQKEMAADYIIFSFLTPSMFFSSESCRHQLSLRIFHLREAASQS